jgi:hypothetical protein
MGLRHKISFFTLLLILGAGPLCAVDFGVVLDVTPEYDSTEAAGFSVTGIVLPWVSALFSPTLSLYVSAAVSIEAPFFEMDRTELSWRPLPALFLQFGRQRFGDSAGLIADGLFDGLHGSWGLGAVRLSLGAFYTGLLYKETAKILMTGHDVEMYGMEWNYADISTYFASQRILLPLTAEFPALINRSSLVLNGIAQFDVNGIDTLHSQYLELKYQIEPLNPLHLTIAGVAEMSESPDFRLGFAAFTRADWELPSALQDLLSLQLRWSSGRMNDVIGAYLPVSGISAGEIYTPRLQGLMYASAIYKVRPLPALSAEAGAGYFIRTDLETLQDGLTADSYTLGGELYGSLVWTPQSIISITTGGGAFFPGWGGAFVTGAKIRWKARVGIMVSF